MVTLRDLLNAIRAFQTEVDTLPLAAIHPGLPPNLTALVSYIPGDVLSSATYTSPAGETYTDINGVTQTAGLNVPRNAHYIGTTRTHLLSTADAFTIPWSATPVPMTVYLRVIDQGFTAAAAGGDVVIYSVGNGNNRFTLLATSTGYTLNYRVAGTDHKAVDNTNQAVSGDVLEFRCTLSASGAIGLSHTRNGGAESTPATLTGATTLGADTFTRANSASTLGTATTGGAWTAVGTLAGITNNKGYWASDRAGGNLAYLTVASLPDTVSVDIQTNNTHYYSAGPLLRYVDTNNYLRLTFLNGTALLESRVAGTTTTRGSFATTLPAAASATFTASATILSNVVTCYVNGVSVGTYTLSGTEISAYGTSLLVGVAGAAAGTVGTSCTFDNFSATSGSNTVALPVAWDSANIDIGSLGGASAGAMAIVALVVVAGAVTLTRSKSANRHPIAAGPDITPAAIVLSPATVTALTTGGPINFTSTVTNQAGSVLTTAQAPVTYSSDTPSVITINSSTGVATPVAAGSAVIRAQTTVAGVFDTTAVTLSAPASTRTLIYPHARFRIIQRWTGATDDAFANTHYSDIDGGTLTSHPNAISVQHYGILLTSESNGEQDFNGTSWTTPQDFPLVLFLGYADSYATAHSQNVEDYWMHAQAGQANSVAGIWSISPAGVVLFYYPTPGGGPISSYPFTAGQTVTLAGLSTGNGTYTIASLQKYGVTLTGWSAGQLGPTSAVVPSNSKIGTVQTVGDGTLVKANRIQSFGWASWVLQCSFQTAGAKAMHAQRFADYRGDTNGVLIDNMASGANYNGMTASQEYGPQQRDVNNQVTAAPAFMTDVAATLTGILAQAGGPKYLRINNAAYTFANDTTLIRAAKGAHDESSLTLIPYDQTELNFVIARVNEGNDVEYSNGSSYTVTGGVGILRDIPSGYNGGNYPTGSTRGIMSLYCLYLMAVDASYTAPDGSTQKHAILDLTNGFSVGQGPLSAFWQTAFEYNIGQPTGAMTQTQKTDASGQAIRTLTRSFSLDGGTTLSAVVVTNHNVNGQTNYGDTSLVTTALPLAPSGKAWFMLNADGTFGTTPLTSVAHRRSEGVIVVAQTAGVLAQRADAFVDSIGVNTHLLAEPYLSHFNDLFVPAVQALGVRKIRDNTVGTGATNSFAAQGVSNMAALAQQAGVTYSLITKPGGASYSDTSFVDYVVSQIDPLILAYFEGPNEINNTTYYGTTATAQGTNVTTWMNALKAYRDASPSATVRAVPITTPSVVPGAAIPAVSWAAQSAYGVAHPYPGPNEPGAPLASAIASVASIWGGVGALPVLVTESGYETALNASGPSYLIGQGVTPLAQAKYLGRLFAEYLSQGVVNTFGYELFDDGTDYTQGENGYGMIAAGGTPKAAYTTIQNTIALLAEKTWTPPAFTVGSGDFTTGVFTTANQNAWPNVTGADTSKTWAPESGTESALFKILSNTGQLIAGPARNVVGDAHSGGHDVVLTFTGYRSGGYSNAVEVALRYVDSNNYYAFRMNGGTTPQMTLTQRVAGVSTVLCSANSAAVTGLTQGALRFRLTVSGTTHHLYCRAWDTSGAEPSTWNCEFIVQGGTTGALASGKAAVLLDNNASGQSIAVTAFRSSSASVAAGSWSALAPLTLGRLAYTLSGTTANVRTLLLEKADGSFWLLLWQRATSYDTSTKTDIAVAPASVTISTTATHNWLQYTPSASQTSTVIGSGTTSVTVNVPDELLVLKIS